MLPNNPLTESPIANIFLAKGITTFNGATQYIATLPYARVSDPSNLISVLSEKQGTCSSKHALIAALAAEQDIDVTLVIGIYMMNQNNTPGVGSVLEQTGIKEIPEAHCFLEVGEQVFDFTGISFGSTPIEFYERYTVKPQELHKLKPSLHKAAIKNWAQKTKNTESESDLWKIREQCIQAITDAQMVSKLA